MGVAYVAQGCSSKTEGSPATNPPLAEAGNDSSAPPPGGDDGGGPAPTPDDAGGCIGADAGVLALTSDSKPISFVVADTDPATGDWQDPGGQGKYVAQVFASGTAGAWTANLLHAFDQPNDMPAAVLTGTVKSCTEIDFTGAGWTATLKDGAFTGSSGGDSFSMVHVLRKSPTLGAAPPAGGTMLFDGTSFDNWEEKAGQMWLTAAGPSRWKLVDGAMEVVPNTDSLITKQSFGDGHFHVEFRTVGTPSHSGPFLEARYQLTVLQDYGSFSGNATGNLGNEPVPGTTSAPINPTIRAGRAPLEWQTFDIDFHAPAFNGTTKTANAKITVQLNGVTIFDNQDLAWPVTGAAARFPEAATGPLLLEYHGMPVQYRNIWIAPLAP
jgi:hypothetical protein